MVLFCGTVTDAGTVATEGVKLDKLITCPPAGAMEVKVTVIVPDEFADKANGSGVSVIVLEIAVMVTVDGTLLANTSLTISCTTYVPATSGTKVGDELVAACSVAVLPAGRLLKVHAKVNASPSASEENVPFRLTTAATAAVWFTPALATGAVFVVVIVTVDG